MYQHIEYQEHPSGEEDIWNDKPRSAKSGYSLQGCAVGGGCSGLG